MGYLIQTYVLKVEQCSFIHKLRQCCIVMMRWMCRCASFLFSCGEESTNDHEGIIFVLLEESDEFLSSLCPSEIENTLSISILIQLGVFFVLFLLRNAQKSPKPSYI